MEVLSVLQVLFVHQGSSMRFSVFCSEPIEATKPQCRFSSSILYIDVFWSIYWWFYVNNSVCNQHTMTSAIYCSIFMQTQLNSVSISFECSWKRKLYIHEKLNYHFFFLPSPRSECRGGLRSPGYTRSKLFAIILSDNLMTRLSPVLFYCCSSSPLTHFEKNILGGLFAFIIIQQ